MIQSFSMPDAMLSYGRVKWDRDVWERMLPTLRHHADDDPYGVIAICIHRCMFDAFVHLDSAASSLSQLTTAIDSLDRRSTTVKAELFLSLDDFNRARETCDRIIAMARAIRSDPVNLAQASVLLAVTP
jgi:hypothetical protein